MWVVGHHSASIPNRILCAKIDWLLDLTVKRRTMNTMAVPAMGRRI